MGLLNIIIRVGAVLVAWMVISQILAGLIACDRSEDDILSMWMCVFLAPILIAYLLVSWLQMKWTMQLYNLTQAITFGAAPIKQPSQDLRDYIP